MVNFWYQKISVLAVILLFLFLPIFEAMAEMTSDDYEIEPYTQDYGGGPVESDKYDAATSIGEIGEGFEGDSQDLGSGYPPMLGDEAVIIVKALPEKRRPPVGPGHLRTRLKLELARGGILYLSQFSDSDDITGEATYLVDLDQIGRGGISDVGVKGFSHLKLIKRNITITGGNNYIDMSDAETVYLLAGDTNGLEGDNSVNSLDISVIIDNYHTPFERTDFNLEGDTNSIDLGILVDNYHKFGDEF